MADRPSTSTSRAGRPRTKSVHQTPCVPVGKPKVGRPKSKSAHASKADEDAEAHLLRTIDWMDTHNFPNDQKVRRFCLTLTSEARL